MLSGIIVLHILVIVRSDAIPLNIEAFYLFMNGVVNGILISEF